jgi:peptide/nickel transport system substrate-binding protein
MASETGNFWGKFTSQRVHRRQFLRGVGLTGAGAIALSLIGCSDGTGKTPQTGELGTGGGRSPGDPKMGGVLKASIGTAAPVTFDMHQEIFFYSLWPANMMYNQLLKFDQYEAEKVIPDLAASYETPEPTKIVFKLNEANFHDGTPFTSADVKASIERIKSPPTGVRSPRQAQFTVVTSVDTPDARTAVFNMQRPSASFFSTLAHMNPAMYSVKDMANPDFHKTKVNGTGPFMLDRVDTGSLVVLKKNPNYFRKGFPYLDGWEWYVLPEAVANLAAFQSGNVDMYGPAAADIANVSKMTDVELVQAPGTTWYATTIATQKAPWNDPRIWKAVSMAISKQDFNQVQSLGGAEIGAALPPSNKYSLTEKELLQIPGYKGIGDGKEGDMTARRTEAKKLLSAAGITDGQPAKVLSWGPNFVNWATVFKDGLEQVGLKVELNMVELGVYNERLAAHDFGDMAANSRTAVFPDPTPVYADNFIKGAGRFYTDLVIPEVEDLFIKQDSELDTEKRFDLQHQMQLAHQKAYPDISCYTITNQAFYKRVKNYGVQYGGLFQSRKNEEVWLDRA